VLTRHERGEKQVLGAGSSAVEAVISRLDCQNSRTGARHLPQLISRHTASATLMTASGCSASAAATEASENIAMVRSVEPVATRLSSLLTATVMMFALCTACSRVRKVRRVWSKRAAAEPRAPQRQAFWRGSRQRQQRVAAAPEQPATHLPVQLA
jgi:hypothetical protein